MKIGVLLVFLFWYGMLSAVYFAIPTEIQEGTINFDLTDNLNVTGFEQGELDDDTGGFFSFFSPIAGVFKAIGRFLGFVGFGIGLPPDTPGYVKFFFFLWNTMITTVLVAWIISIVVDG